jgi:hypothetical protein
MIPFHKTSRDSKMSLIPIEKRLGMGGWLYITSRPCYASKFRKGKDASPVSDCIESFLDRMASHNIRTIVVLMPISDILAEYGVNLLKVYQIEGYAVYHFPIKDFSVPNSLPAFDEFMEDLADIVRYDNTAVHCSAGKGRSGLAVAGLFVYLGYTAEKATRLIRTYRPGTVETKGQEAFLRRYELYRKGWN